MSDGIRCLNCGYPIRWINYSFAPRWMHQHPGAAGDDGVYEFCKLSVATPPDGRGVA